MRELPDALLPLATYRQFIVYKLVPSTNRPGKTDKFPCDFRNGHVVSAHDPAYWTDSLTAIASATQYGSQYGVGFVFTEHDPFWFLDIDNCLLPDGSGWNDTAKYFCHILQGAAIEISQSLKGLHIFGTGRPPAHGSKNAALGLEFYHSGRFVALTGINTSGSATKDCSEALPALVGTYFPPDAAIALQQGWTDQPVAEWRGPVDDDILIQRALRSRSSASAFGNKASFADLWTANLQALAACYPDGGGRAYDSSAADAALAQHLSFWTGKNCERIRKLMERSSLSRDKWSREDYLPRTIIGAVSRQFDVLTDKEIELPQAPTSEALPTSLQSEKPKPRPVEGKTFLNPADQISMFIGCVYIRELHRILVPGGSIIKPEQFKVYYGGCQFVINPSNDKTTKDSWEAFTQNQCLRPPMADRAGFSPMLEPGIITTRGGQSYVNTYVPVDVPRKHGDPTPFLTHLSKVLPDDRDRLILLSYMAACVQHKGVKFQWAPLLQGVEGNGKTLFTRCVAEAIGSRYVHWPKASKLSKEFNGWMINKLFYAVEDIYVPDQKREIIEELKPMITGGDGLEIESKGVDQISADICGNFMFNSNHKDAVRKTQNDRRFCVLFSAQQQEPDLKKYGMDGDYFPNLYNWLRSEGYAIVTDFLNNFPIPNEFNPATNCQRAPATTSTSAAIIAGKGSVEQEIEEAIAQGLPGFCGGWISSVQLDRLLEKLRVARRLSHHKRKEMLESLTYVHHPALPNGRVNKIIMPDGAKSRLFISTLSPSYAIMDPQEAIKDYETKNNHTRVPFPA